MTLLQLIQAIEKAAGGQPAVRSIVRNDVYRLNACPDAHYGVFAWLQGEHRAGVDASLVQYAFTFFYVDRLTADKANEIEVQSVGMQVLQNVAETLKGLDVWPVGDLVFRTFNERFADECAGVYCTLTLEVPRDYTCASLYEFLNGGNDIEII